MCRRKPKILKYRIREIKILWIVLHIKVYRKGEWKFTAVHLFCWCEICLILFFLRAVFIDLCEKFDWIQFCFGGDSVRVYCFMLGCLESMDFCVSHTCFISFFTSSTSALYTLPVAFIRFAIWFRLPLIFPSATL